MHIRDEKRTSFARRSDRTLGWTVRLGAFQTLISALLSFFVGTQAQAGLAPGTGPIRHVEPIPYVETLNVSRWADLPGWQRQRLTEGALDALDREADPMVRALSARLLSLGAIGKPNLILQALGDRVDVLHGLVADTEADRGARILVFKTFATLFAVDPSRFPWAEPPREYFASALAAFRDAIRSPEIVVSRDHQLIRRMLRDALHQDNWSMLSIAIDSLASFGLQAADVEAIVDRLDDPDADVRRAARAALNDADLDSAAAEVLRTWSRAHLDHKDPRIRSAAVEALGRLALQATDVEAIMERLSDPDAGVRIAARATLDYADLDSAAVESLRNWSRAHLKSDERTASPAAIENLAWLGLQAADVEAIVDRLDDPDADVRRAARAALSDAELDSAAAEVLRIWSRAHLDDNHPRVRSAAVEVLGRLALQATDVEATVEHLSEPDASVRGTAVTLDYPDLGSAAVGDLQNLSRGQPEDDERTAPPVTIENLAWLGLQAADVEAIVDRLDDPDADVRRAARAALDYAALDSAAGEDLRNLSRVHLRDDKRTSPAAIENLAWLGLQAADVEAIVDRLGDPNADVRRAARAALNDAELDSAAAEVLRTWSRAHLDHKDPPIRSAAVEALGRLALQATDVEAIVERLSDPDVDVQFGAVTALVAPGAPSWELDSAFVDLAIREAARMTIDRDDVWAYADGILESFMSNDRAKSNSVEIFATGADDDKGVAFALALRSSGISDAAFPRMLDLAHFPSAGPMARFFLRLLTENPNRATLDVLGAVQTPSWDRFGRGATGARLLFSTFQVAEKERLGNLRQEAAQRLAEVAQHDGEWSEDNVEDLELYASTLPSSFQPAMEARIEEMERERLFESITEWTSVVVVLHATLWLILAFAYPHVTVIQAVFFWNPWVRKIGGLGYAVPLLMLVPPLRRRLVAPFIQTLLADARLATFEPQAYYTKLSVRLLVGDRSEGKLQRLEQAIPEVKGHVILEGASGLGKTEFLRALAMRSARPLAFLPARRVAEAGGPLQAIQAKMQGWARDPGFICSLLHVNALDLAIDGLNEIGAEARAKIVSFVEDLPKANVILTTQPIAWEPPQAGATRRFELQPLDVDQIADFLVSREERIDWKKRFGLDYSHACGLFLCDTVSNAPSDEERRQNLLVLSNPMDLTLVAELIAAGETPSLAALIEQQYERAAVWFLQTQGRPFPLAAVAFQAFELRRRDDNRIDVELAALDSMHRFKLVLKRESMDAPGTAEYVFRHDKIMDMFIAAHLLDAAGDTVPEDLVGDARFSGVLIELAVLLPVSRAWRLGKHIAEDAERTGEHWVSSVYMRKLLARSDIPRAATAA